MPLALETYSAQFLLSVFIYSLEPDIENKSHSTTCIIDAHLACVCYGNQMGLSYFI